MEKWAEKKMALEKGQKFRKLTIMEFSDPYKRYAICSCDCGGTKITATGYLIQGKVQSCGCLQKEVMQQRNTTHGECKKGKTHTYHIWVKMRRRCSNPKDNDYKWYGKRGIKVCERWEDYANFLQDMGEVPKGHSIDRTDVDGDYCIENCKWIPKNQQAKNTRKGKNKHLFLYPYKNKISTLGTISKDTGISVDDLYLYLLRKLMPLEKVIEKFIMIK